MGFRVTGVSEGGSATRNDLDDFELTVDASGEEGPDPNEVLVADYASCYVSAFRAAGDREDVGDLGRIRIDASAEVDDDGDLSSIGFEMDFESDLDEETFERLVDEANELCHVRSALHEGLYADVLRAN